MSDVGEKVALAIGICTLGGLLVGYLRVIRPRLRKAAARIGAALDTIAGRGPVMDSITGKQLAPELPSIGKRMDAMEGSVSRLVEVIEGQHKQDERLDDHETRLKRLEEQTVERVATKVESTQAWRAIEAVAHQSDSTTPEP